MPQYQGSNGVLPSKGHVAMVSNRRSLLGCGENDFGGNAVRVSFGPINSARIFSCCRNDEIISGVGEVLATLICDRSRIETFATSSKTQITVNPAQIPRQGQIS